MLVKISSLLRDSLNFLKNQLFNIFMLSLISGIISLSFHNFFVFSNESEIINKILIKKNDFSSFLNLIHEMSDSDKTILINIFLRYICSIFFSLIFLFSSILTYIEEANNKKCINIAQIIINSLYIFPNMFILLFICIVVFYFGLMFFIIPGFVIIFGFSLSPVILVRNKNITPLLSIKESWKISFQNSNIIVFIFFIWFIIKLFISFLFKELYIFSNIINNIIYFTLNNIVISFVLIYFFRFCMLNNNCIK